MIFRTTSLTRSVITIVSDDKRTVVNLYHLREGGVFVKQGCHVDAEQKVGESGASGAVYSTQTKPHPGEHLHVDVTYDGKSVNPESHWLNKQQHHVCETCPACADDKPATAQVSAPTDGAQIQGPFIVEGSATDNSGLKKVTVAVNWSANGIDANHLFPICDNNCSGSTQAFAAEVDPASFGVPNATQLTLAVWVRDVNDVTSPPLVVRKIDWFAPCQGPTKQGCGNCGTQTRVCQAGKWSSWSQCMNPGQCAPGSVQACGVNGSQTCSTQCQWEPCQSSGPACGKQVNWVAKAPLSAPDQTTVSAVFGGKIHVFGYTHISRHRVYDPATNTWTQKADLPYPAYTGWAGAIGQSLYAFGEGIVDNAYPMQWDEASDTWSLLASDPWPRDYPVGAIINGKVYLATGWSLNKAIVNRFDPELNTWTDLAPIPQLAGGSISGLNFNGKLYLFAVVAGNGDPTQTWAYDPASNNWQQFASLPQTRSLSRPIIVAGKIWLLGGRDSVGQDSIYVYDTVADTWCTGGTLPKPLSGFAVQQVNGKVYLIGGQDVNGNSVPDVWEGTIQ